MFDKLGIVTNIWAHRIEAGDRFEDLVALFRKNGFQHMELRDGDYLRQSEFGEFLGKIEAAMAHYTDDQWKTICDTLANNQPYGDLLGPEDQSLFARIGEFNEKTTDIVFSYAMAHPWHVPPENAEADNHRIVQAKKLAYFLYPDQARLRLVDPEFGGEVDTASTVANLKRYQELLPNYLLTLAVENAQKSATITLDLAVKGDVKLAYDEANTFRTDGDALNPPDAFWNAVGMDVLTSVHIKQKTAEGISAQIGNGYVDFEAILNRLKTGGYTGDLLLENAPTDDPLQNAIKSRECLLSIS